MDSNLRFRARDASASRLRPSISRPEVFTFGGATHPPMLRKGPKVRIHLPPPARIKKIRSISISYNFASYGFSTSFSTSEAGLFAHETAAFGPLIGQIGRAMRPNSRL